MTGMEGRRKLYHKEGFRWGKSCFKRGNTSIYSVGENLQQNHYSREKKLRCSHLSTGKGARGKGDYTITKLTCPNKTKRY